MKPPPKDLEKVASRASNNDIDEYGPFNLNIIKGQAADMPAKKIKKVKIKKHI